MHALTHFWFKKTLHFFIKAVTSPLDLFIYTLIYSLLTAKLRKLLSGAGCSAALALYACNSSFASTLMCICLCRALHDTYTTPRNFIHELAC